MADKKLVRSANKKIAGVCGGLAEYFGMDASLVRIIYLLATIFTAFAGAADTSVFGTTALVITNANVSTKATTRFQIILDLIIFPS